MEQEKLFWNSCLLANWTRNIKSSKIQSKVTFRSNWDVFVLVFVFIWISYSWSFLFQNQKGENYKKKKFCSLYGFSKLRFFFFHFSPLWTPPSKLQLYNLFTFAINNSIVVTASKKTKMIWSCLILIFKNHIASTH